MEYKIGNLPLVTVRRCQVVCGVVRRREEEGPTFILRVLDTRNDFV